jgi:hypothetical protein
VDEVNYYVAGLIAGEGGFSICIARNPTQKTGKQVRIRFSMVSTSREILELVKKTLKCGGSINEFPTSLLTARDGYERRKTWQYQIQSNEDMIKIVIPFLEKYSIIPLSKINPHYKAVKEVAEMIKRKEHLTEEGIRKIESIARQISQKADNSEIKPSEGKNQKIRRLI